MTVNDLIAKLREYPMDSELDFRFTSAREDKIAMIAKGRELDPILQCKRPITYGFGPME